MQVSVVAPHNLWEPREQQQVTAAPAAAEPACDCGCGNEVDPCSTPLEVHGATEITAKYPCRCDKTRQQLAGAQGGQSAVTKGDLEEAVERIVSGEAKALGLQGGSSKVSVGQDPSLATWLLSLLSLLHRRCLSCRCSYSGTECMQDASRVMRTQPQGRDVGPLCRPRG